MVCPNLQLFPKTEVFYRPESPNVATTSKLILPVFKYKIGAEKVDEKIGSFVSFPCFFPELWLLNCPKMTFLNKKSKSVKAMYRYACESSHYTLSDNGMVYRGMRHRS